MSVSATKQARRAAEREAGMRLPLIYATGAALEKSRRLMPRRVLENEVGRAIAAGRLAGGEPRSEEDSVRVFLDDGIVAFAVRSRSRFSGRKTWLITGLHKEVT